MWSLKKNRMSLTIKKINNSALDSIAEIHLETYSNVDNFSKLLSKDYLKRIYSFFINNGYGFVAYLDNKPVGFIVATYLNSYKLFNFFQVINILLYFICKPNEFFKKNNEDGTSNKFLKRIKGRIMFNKFIYMNNTFGEYNGIYIYSIAMRQVKNKYLVFTQLFEKLESIAKEQHRKYIIASVGKNNIASLLLYKSLPGYSVHIDEYNKFSDEIFFVKKLN